MKLLLMKIQDLTLDFSGADVDNDLANIPNIIILTAHGLVEH